MNKIKHSKNSRVFSPKIGDMLYDTETKKHYMVVNFDLNMNYDFKPGIYVVDLDTGKVSWFDTTHEINSYEVQLVDNITIQAMRQ